MTALFRFYIFCSSHFYRKHRKSLTNATFMLCFSLISNMICMFYFWFFFVHLQRCEHLSSYPVLQLLFSRYCMMQLLIFFPFHLNDLSILESALKLSLAVPCRKGRVFKLLISFFAIQIFSYYSMLFLWAQLWSCAHKTSNQLL